MEYPKVKIRQDGDAELVINENRLVGITRSAIGFAIGEQCGNNTNVVQQRISSDNDLNDYSLYLPNGYDWVIVQDGLYLSLIPLKKENSNE